MIDYLVIFACILPAKLLLGFIKSIEDHGYIVDFGIKGKSGFLLKKNAAEFVKTYRRGKALCVGQVLQCLVLMGTDTKAVPITINPSQASVAMMRKDEMIGMKSLLPGILVRAAVKQVHCARIRENIVLLRVTFIIKDCDIRDDYKSTFV